MFSDHLQKLHTINGRGLFFVACGLVIVCQLVAMSMVVGEQVKKAELRDSRMLVQRAAIAQCLEGNSHAERQSCIQQVRNTMPQDARVAGTEAGRPADREAASYTDFNRKSSSPAVRAGVMSVSFAAN